MNTKIWISVLCSILALPTYAQSAEAHIQQGNTKYRNQDFAGAQAEYEPAGETVEALYNLGNALYAQKQYEHAVTQYDKAARQSNDPNMRSGAYHNLGNALLEQKKYEMSIDAYKKASKFCRNAWADRHLVKTVASIAIVDPDSGERWIIDATPDLPNSSNF